MDEDLDDSLVDDDFDEPLAGEDIDESLEGDDLDGVDDVDMASEKRNTSER